MENMTKALLIAAAMMTVVLVLSAMMMGYNRITSYYEQEHELTMIEQTEKFNKTFENYNRNGIRGNDMISLMNKVIDYNASQSYQEQTSYQRIRVTVNIGTSNLEYFQYDRTEPTNYLKSIITNTTGNTTVDDKQLILITNTTADIIEYGKNNGINGLTDEKLQRLSSEIGNIMVVENENPVTTGATKTRLKRAQVLESILGLKVGYSAEPGDYDIRINKITAKTETGHDIINKIKYIAKKYYEYTQFKRAKFNCEKIEYDAATRRVVEMNFVVQTNSNGVVFN